MTERVFGGVLCMVLCISCSSGNGRQPAEPIPNVPDDQQRTISRSELDWRWPFRVGTGTVGCLSGAVVFRANGVDYALNDAAKARGFSAVDSIWLTQHSGPPRNPFKGMKQDQRMQVFARVAACRAGAPGGQVAEAQCRQRVRDAHQLNDDQLKQIEAEGEERRWPPLPAQRKDLGPLLEAGQRLCQG
jgi:hypothetical protein